MNLNIYSLIFIKKTFTIITLFIIVSFSIPSMLLAAQPTISSLKSSFINGQNISLTGKWDTTGDNTPLVWDNFESIPSGNKLSATPMVGSWSLRSNPTPTIYSNKYSHSGTQSAYTPPHHSGYANMRNDSLTTKNKIYWSFWFRFNDGGATGYQTKLFQLWGNGADLCNYGPGVMSGGFSDSWFASYNIASGSDCTTGKIKSNYTTGAPSQNVWHYGEMILERSSNYGVSDGTVIIRIDNRNVYNQAGNLLTRMNGEDWRSALFFYSMTNDGGAGSFAIDDSYLNDSWSRVVLGNASTYSESTVLDIQPVTTWNTTSITFTANQGNYRNGDKAFLFVVDSSGLASSGYPVTIGSDSGGGVIPAIVPPAAPTNLKITMQ